MAKINELFSIRHYGLKKTLIREDDEEEEYIYVPTYIIVVPRTVEERTAVQLLFSPCFVHNRMRIQFPRDFSENATQISQRYSIILHGID